MKISARFVAIATLLGSASNFPSLAFAVDISVSHGSANYQLFPIGSDGSSVWLLNVKTGSLSKCISTSIDQTPECSPWAEPPGENAVYRYDPKTKKSIPMNEAARQKEREK